jgi:hypothetical protein
MKTKTVKRIEAIQRLESGVVADADIFRLRFTCERAPDGLVGVESETREDIIARRRIEAARLRKKFAI